MTTIPRILAASGLALSLAHGALGQASFVQNFDNIGEVQSGQHGPSGLIAQGWIFRNQSQPQGFGYWFPITNYSQAGAGCLGINTNVASWTSNSSMGSSWAILPAVPNQRAGDPVSFWITDGYMAAGQYARLQLRYSPGGGTSTGSGPNDSGDFSQVLLDIPNVNERPWTQFTAAAPGTGRLALRFVQPAGPNYQFYGNFSIDTLTVGTPPAPPFPLPQPGQTVHWTLANSPVLITYDTTIVAGGTVIVDPGVEVRISPTMKLHLDGTIDARDNTRFVVPIDAQFNINGIATFAGTAASPVHLDGGPAWFGGDNGYQVKRTGRIEINHGVIAAMIKGAPYIYNHGGAEIKATDVSIQGPDCGFRVEHGTLALRNASFTGGSGISLIDSYLLTDNLTLDASLLRSERYKAGQPIYFNRITAQNLASMAPFQLSGFDHFFGAQNTITNNFAAVRLDGAGIAPGSTLPSTGNQINNIDAGYGEGGGKITYANIGIPYQVTFPGTYVPELSGRLTIEPGTRILMGPQAILWAKFGTRVDAEGLPSAPIRFEQLLPGQKFQGINFAVNSTRPKLEYCLFDGGTLSVISDESFVRVESSTIQNSDVGGRVANYGALLVRKSRILNNSIGIQTGATGAALLYSTTNHNSFDGNSTWAVQSSSSVDANLNYWGDPSGPQHPQNPGGMGDPVTAAVSVFPFLTQEPDFADTPPVVRLEDTSFLLEAGNKVILRWTASDDHAITGFKILYSPHGENPGLSLLVDNIPATARSWEVTIPQPPGASNYPDPSAFRVEATDSAGQTGFDDIDFFTPTLDFQGSTPPQPIPGIYRPGDTVDVCYTVQGGASGTTDAWLFLDGDEQGFSLGGAHTGVTCLPLGLTMPPVSTDNARVGIRYNMGAGGRNLWSFTDYFSIRPDPAITGDAPPAVQLTSPAPSQSFPGGSTVPIAWIASDDESLRSFMVQASYDAGRTWHVVERNIPGAARSYSWLLPPSTGIADVRLRVIATDQRFQNSSTPASFAISITPGSAPPPCYANCDGSTAPPVLNVLDFNCFLNRFSAGDAYANCDGSTVPPTLNILDFNCFLNRFNAGCP